MLGERKFKNFTDSIKLKDPLINIPKIINLLCHSKIKSIASHYFGVMPYLTFVKLVKSYKNKYKDHDTQLFHIDDNSVNLLKCFIYLNDVNSKNDGPLYYIKYSFKNIRNYWGKNLRWSEKRLLNIYGKENAIPICAKKGDVILVNTIAFHRGIKPSKKNRYCIIANYGLHPDFTYNNKFDLTSKISTKHFVNQTRQNKKILSLLRKV